MDQRGQSLMRESYTDEGIERLFIPQVITPAQFYGKDTLNDGGSVPIERLMLAVLTDAIRCLRTDTASLPLHRKQLCLEAHEWIFKKGGAGPFSFEAVCGALDIEPDYLRARLRKWTQSGDPARMVLRARTPVITRTRINPTNRRRSKRSALH
jgi:hypothetical protein